MRLLRTALQAPWVHVGVLTAIIGLVFLHTEVSPMDDHFHYQQFIKTLAQRRVDFAIPGFHGASFLSLPLYLLTRSDLANIEFQILCALLLVPVGYAAASALLHDRFQAILFAYALALMPFFSFSAFRGFTFPSFTLFVLLTLLLRARGSAFAWLPWGISMLIKPFSIALLPFFLFWQPNQQNAALRRGWVQCALALLIPLLYVIAEYAQVGRIIVGAHAGIDQSNVFLWSRLPLNIVHGIQMLFSVHNYYYPDPALTGAGNLAHTSPVIVMFGLLSLAYPRMFWDDRRLAGVFAISLIIAYLLAASLDHMDHFYMETVVLLLTLAALPAFSQFRLFIPLALGTLHFQFFYLYLQYRGVFFHDTSLFWIVGAVDILALFSWLILVAPIVRWRDICSPWHS